MCIAHWRMVPAPLRRAVRDAFQRWRRAISRRRGRGCTEDTFSTVTELRKVQQMSINAVVEKMVRRDINRQEGQSALFGR